MNPADGSAVSGRTTYVGFSSSDDHSVKELVVYLDNALVATKVLRRHHVRLSGVVQVVDRRVREPHTATYQSTDWMGNVAK